MSRQKEAPNCVQVQVHQEGVVWCHFLNVNVVIVILAKKLTNKRSKVTLLQLLPNKDLTRSAHFKSFLDEHQYHFYLSRSPHMLFK